jgi:hypothetical protein
MKKPGSAGLFSSETILKTRSVCRMNNKDAAKRPGTKEGGREEEKSRSRIASGLTAPGRLRGNNRVLDE